MREGQVKRDGEKQHDNAGRILVQHMADTLILPDANAHILGHFVKVAPPVPLPTFCVAFAMFPSGRTAPAGMDESDPFCVVIVLHSRRQRVGTPCGTLAPQPSHMECILALDVLLNSDGIGNARCDTMRPKGKVHVGTDIRSAEHVGRGGEAL